MVEPQPMDIGVQYNICDFSEDIIIEIFKFIKPMYFPFIKLVCKQWYEIIIKSKKFNYNKLVKFAFHKNNSLLLWGLENIYTIKNSIQSLVPEIPIQLAQTAIISGNQDTVLKYFSHLKAQNIYPNNFIDLHTIIECFKYNTENITHNLASQYLKYIIIIENYNDTIDKLCEAAFMGCQLWFIKALLVDIININGSGENSFNIESVMPFIKEYFNIDVNANDIKPSANVNLHIWKYSFVNIFKHIARNYKVIPIICESLLKYMFELSNPAFHCELAIINSNSNSNSTKKRKIISSSSNLYPTLAHCNYKYTKSFYITDDNIIRYDNYNQNGNSYLFYPLLYELCKAGNFDIIKNILSYNFMRDIRPDDLCDYRQTLIIAASFSGNLILVDYLYIFYKCNKKQINLNTFYNICRNAIACFDNYNEDDSDDDSDDEDDDDDDDEDDDEEYKYGNIIFNKEMLFWVYYTIISNDTFKTLLPDQQILSIKTVFTKYVFKQAIKCGNIENIKFLVSIGCKYDISTILIDAVIYNRMYIFDWLVENIIRHLPIPIIGAPNYLLNFDNLIYHLINVRYSPTPMQLKELFVNTHFILSATHWEVLKEHYDDESNMDDDNDFVKYNELRLLLI